MLITISIDSINFFILNRNYFFKKILFLFLFLKNSLKFNFISVFEKKYRK